jgi:hypothetical protein
VAEFGLSLPRKAERPSISRFLSPNKPEPVAKRNDPGEVEFQRIFRARIPTVTTLWRSSAFSKSRVPKCRSRTAVLATRCRAANNNAIDWAARMYQRLELGVMVEQPQNLAIWCGEGSTVFPLLWIAIESHKWANW